MDRSDSQHHEARAFDRIIDAAAVDLTPNDLREIKHPCPRTLNALRCLNEVLAA